MRILGIVGSPNRDGLTDKLVQRALSGACAAGAEAETMHLSAEDIHPCRGCRVQTCWDDGVCRLDERAEARNQRIKRADEEIGKDNEDKERGVAGAGGRLAQAENRHAELLVRRERRRQELERQRSLTLQAVERMASVLVLPHPEREAPDVRGMRPNPETEATAMRVVKEDRAPYGGEEP